MAHPLVFGILSAPALEPHNHCTVVAACCGYSRLSMPVLLLAQELNLFCTLCTSLFALGCLVLSIINGPFKASDKKLHL